MFGSFRKHQKWIWAVIIIGLIPGLGIFLWVDDGTFSGGGGQARSATEFELYGQPVLIKGKPVSPEDVLKARNELMIRYFVRSGGRGWPQENEQLLESAISRVFMIEKLKELQIEVSEKTVVKMAQSWLGGLSLRNLETEILNDKGLTSDDFERYWRHEAAVQQLAGVAALEAKLIIPVEAEQFYRLENQEVAVELAVFWGTNFQDKVELTPEKVGLYYTNSQARYRVPERAVLSYVEFPATNFLAEADQKLGAITNLEEQIEKMYYQQGTNSFQDTNGVVLSADAAKAKIREETRLQLGLRAAHQKANELGTKLSEQSETNQTENLERLAEALGYTVQVTPPFDRFEGLDESFPPAFKEVGLKLSKDRPVAFDPVRGERAVYVVAFKESIPSSVTPFDQIQEKVTSDFRDFEAAKLARSAATNFYAILTNGLAQGKTFSELTVQEKVHVLSPPPFSAGTTNVPGLDPRVDLRMVQSMVGDLNKGEVSRFVPTRDGGVIAYLRDRLPIDEAKMARELPAVVGRLRLYRLDEAFNQWFSKQADQARLVIPRPQTEKSTSSAPPTSRPL